MGVTPEPAPEWPVRPGKRQNVTCSRWKSEIQVVTGIKLTKHKHFLMKWDRDIMKVYIIVWERRTTAASPPTQKGWFLRAGTAPLGGTLLLGQEMTCRGGD